MMPPPPPAKRLTAQVDDFTLHADTAVAAQDRDGLERLARYGARPPFAHRRLRLTASGQVAYRLRRPWFTGQTELVLKPVAFLRRLAALIPPPRQNQTRYHGVFAANAILRAGVTALVPGAPRPTTTAPHPHPRPGGDPCPDRAPSRPPSRPPWSELLRRVFCEDLLVCPRCTGGMQVLATITDPPSWPPSSPTSAPPPRPVRSPRPAPCRRSRSGPAVATHPPTSTPTTPRRPPRADPVPTCARPWLATGAPAASSAGGRKYPPSRSPRADPPGGHARQPAQPRPTRVHPSYAPASATSSRPADRRPA